MCWMRLLALSAPRRASYEQSAREKLITMIHSTNPNTACTDERGEHIFIIRSELFRWIGSTEREGEHMQKWWSHSSSHTFIREIRFFFCHCHQSHRFDRILHIYELFLVSSTAAAMVAAASAAVAASSSVAAKQKPKNYTQSHSNCVMQRRRCHHLLFNSIMLIII